METPDHPEGAGIEEAAHFALEQAGAIRTCHLHPTITIRLGDMQAERLAQTLVTTVVSTSGTSWQPDDVIPVVQRQLREAAQDVCPECKALDHPSAL